TIAVCSVTLENTEITLWRVDTGEKVAAIPVKHGPVTSLAYNPVRKRLALGLSDNTIELWDVIRLRFVRSLANPVEWVSCLRFDRGGEKLAAAARDGTIVLWSSESEEGNAHIAMFTEVARTYRDYYMGRMRPQQTRAHGIDINQLNRIEFTPDGNTLVSLRRGSTVDQWDLRVDSWIAKGRSLANR